MNLKCALLLITVISLIVTACAPSLKNQQPVSEPKLDTSAEDPCVSIANEEERASCYYPLVNNLENPNSKICDTLKDLQYKDACYINAAVWKPDTTLCEKVSVEMKDSCYLEIIKGPSPPEDVAFCDKITIPQFKQRCIDVIGANNRRINTVESVTT